MDTRIIRISDFSTVWLSSSQASLILTDTDFLIESTHSNYVTLKKGSQKGVIFPFQIFAIDGVKYYFGPYPSHYQIVQSTGISWLKSDIQWQSHAADSERFSSLSLILFFFLKIILHNYGLAAEKKKNENFCRSKRTRCRAPWIAAPILWSLLYTAHAPEPLPQARREHQKQQKIIAFVRSLDESAQKREVPSHLETESGAKTKASINTGTVIKWEDEEKTNSAESDLKVTDHNIKSTRHKNPLKTQQKNSSSSSKKAKRNCHDLNPFTALILNPTSGQNNSGCK